MEHSAQDVPRAVDEAEAAGEAVTHLPKSQLVVHHLHCHGELTFEQTAEVLGKTPGAVRGREIGVGRKKTTS